MATKQQWGSSTWFMLHSLAEKIRDEHFVHQKDFLVGLLFKVCQVLPCPSCSAHCSQYISKLKTNSIISKVDYISYLNNIHNNVNRRLNKPTLSLAECRAKYKRAKLIPIINQFINVFSMKDASQSLMMNNMHKIRFVSQFKKDLRDRIKYFDLTTGP